uniref:Peptidase S1 domain-containing protein n=1 Tax=Panagrolaimus sp. ES5 TaxID=591445 RepID=A0AC34FIT9_9BILA
MYIMNIIFDNGQVNIQRSCIARNNFNAVFYKKSVNIQRGTEAKEHGYPYVIFLEIDGGKSRCGGLFIHSSFIVTAYHCLQRGKSIVAIAGINDITKRKDGQQQSVENSSYIKVGEDPKMDIRLIQLSQPFILNEYVKTVQLLKNFEMVVEAPADIIGWGATKHNTFPNTLQVATVNYLEKNHPNCRQVKKEDYHICFANVINNQGACLGDSGSSVILEGETPTEDKIIAIIIDAPNQCFLKNKAYTDAIKTSSFCKELAKIKELRNVCV